MGLKALAAVDAIRVVRVLAVSETFITLEKIETENPTSVFWERFGRELAAMHRERAEHFGFETDNHLGGTPQPNPRISVNEITWCDYFLGHRLRHMLRHPRLSSQKLLQQKFERAEGRMREELERVTEKPSLLHGDLWSGNFMCAPGQVPVLIDPAPYWGHREADIAMTELFGGFAPDFYRSYERHLPLNSGYARRKHIYNLYHLLNHWILFGSGYEGQALATLEHAVTL